MEKNLNDRCSGLVQIRDSIALRLKEFSSVTGYNPDHIAELVLTQWMDNQVQMYGDSWELNRDKRDRMTGRYIPRF